MCNLLWVMGALEAEGWQVEKFGFSQKCLCDCQTTANTAIEKILFLVGFKLCVFVLKLLVNVFKFVV